mgnify:CR=1 FL=1
MATTIISDQRMNQDLLKFMLQVLDLLPKIKPKHMAVVCVDKNGDYYIHRYKSSYVDLQRMALELDNQAVLEMVAQNRDLLDEWDESDG